MTKIFIAAALALAFIAPVAAQETPAGATTEAATEAAQEQQPERRGLFKRLLKGGAKGCGLGALAGLLGGDASTAVQACAIGAIAGGADAYRREMKEVRQLEGEAKAAGRPVEVKTATVAAKNKQSAEKLASLTIGLDAEDLKSGAEQSRPLIARVSKLAASTQAPMMVSIVGSKEQRDAILQEIKASWPANATNFAKVEFLDGAPAVKLTRSAA